MIQTDHLIPSLKMSHDLWAENRFRLEVCKPQILELQHRFQIHGLEHPNFLWQHASKHPFEPAKNQKAITRKR